MWYFKVDYATLEISRISRNLIPSSTHSASLQSLVPKEVSTENWLLDVCHYKRPRDGSAQADIQLNSTVAVCTDCSAICYG